MAQTSHPSIVHLITVSLSQNQTKETKLALLWEYLVFGNYAATPLQSFYLANAHHDNEFFSLVARCNRWRGLWLRILCSSRLFCRFLTLFFPWEVADGSQQYLLSLGGPSSS